MPWKIISDKFVYLWLSPDAELYLSSEMAVHVKSYFPNLFRSVLWSSMCTTVMMMMMLSFQFNNVTLELNNKFYSSIAMLWFVRNSHATLNSQSICFISVSHSYATLKFVYGISFQSTVIGYSLSNGFYNTCFVKLAAK